MGRKGNAASKKPQSFSELLSRNSRPRAREIRVLTSVFCPAIPPYHSVNRDLRIFCCHENVEVVVWHRRFEASRHVLSVDRINIEENIFKLDTVGVAEGALQEWLRDRPQT